MTASLIIFVRSPGDREIKSRLAATLGCRFATDFYRDCARHIIRETARLGSRVERYVFYTSDEGAVRRWLGRRFRFVPQASGELGERIDHAFRTVFSQGAERAIIIATDVPDLSPEIMDEAIRALAEHDVAIGPSCDGGYYLLGMKRPYVELLQNMPWSTNHVYEETLRRIKSMGLSCHVSPTLRDIDTEDDLRQWLAGRARRERWVDRLARRFPLVAEPGKAQNA